MSTISSFEEYKQQYQQSIENPEKFWSGIAETFVWRKKYDSVLKWDFHKPEVKWFEGGKLNIVENCIDRHLADKAKQTAIIWESNFTDEPSRHISYQELFESVNQVANMLRQQGVKKGDRVCIYLPMIPELAFAVLACARIGAAHSVVFAGFSSGSLADRINDSGCKLILTSDGAYRGDKTLDLKSIVDEALLKCPTIEKAVIYKRTKGKVSMLPNRDLWWHDVVGNQAKVCEAEEMDAEDMLFILYTSGSTGKPKGMVHTCGGYMVYTNYTFKTVFQIHLAVNIIYKLKFLILVNVNL